MAGNPFMVRYKVQLANETKKQLGILPATNIGLEIFEIMFATDYTASDAASLAVNLYTADKDGTATTDSTLATKLDPVNPSSLQFTVKKTYTVNPSNMVLIDSFEISGFGEYTWQPPSLRDLLVLPSTKALIVETITPAGTGTPYLLMKAKGRE